METEVLTSEQVASWFRGRCAAEYEPPRPLRDTEFPTSTESMARQPFAYRAWTIKAPKPTILDLDDNAWADNIVHIWDLDDFPPGSLIWRVSSTGTLHVFVRAAADWEHARIEPGEETYLTQWGSFLYSHDGWWLATTS